MVNQVDKAIKTLVNANFFHAAMTIAKIRIPPGHPMVADLYKKWARMELNWTNLEHFLKIYDFLTKRKQALVSWVVFPLKFKGNKP